MTDDTVWNPANVTIATIDTTSDLPLVEVLTRRNLSSLNVSNKSIPEITENNLTPYDDATLLNRMIGNVKVATAHRDAHVAFVGSKDRHSNVNAETVARKFRCGIETGQRTLKTTSLYSSITQALSSRSFEFTPEEARGYLLHGHLILESEIFEWFYVCSTHYERKLYSSIPDGISFAILLPSKPVRTLKY